VEVKCPFTLREMSWDESIVNRNCPFVMRNNVLSLRKKAHHHQVQATLHFTGRNTCDFVVWAPNWLKILSVPKDPEWSNCLDGLLEFYRSHIFPRLYEKYRKR